MQPQWRLTTIQVYYYLPDVELDLTNLFLWQAMDRYPNFPRMHSFVDHWQEKIEARLDRVYILHTDPFDHKCYRNILTIHE